MVRFQSKKCSLDSDSYKAFNALTNIGDGEAEGGAVFNELYQIADAGDGA